VNIRGAGPGRETGHPQGSLEITHIAATQRVYFVEPSNAPLLQTRFRLDATTARGVYTTPMFHGWSLFGEAGIDTFQPRTTTNDTYVSTQSVVTDSVAPGLTASTKYAVYGGGLNFRYPARVEKSDCLPRTSVYNGAQPGQPKWKSRL
jgi:hypothetical protein